MMKTNPFIAEVLDNLTAKLNDEFWQRIETIEFKADYPNRLLEIIGLTEVLRIIVFSKRNTRKHRHK